MSCASYVEVLANIPECLRNSAHFIAGRKPLHHPRNIRLDGCIFIMRSPRCLRRRCAIRWIFHGVTYTSVTSRASTSSVISAIEKIKMFRRIGLLRSVAELLPRDEKGEKKIIIFHSQPSRNPTRTFYRENIIGICVLSVRVRRKHSAARMHWKYA